MESVPDKGSTFAITLPVRRFSCRRPTPPRPRPPRLHAVVVAVAQEAGCGSSHRSCWTVKSAESRSLIRCCAACPLVIVRRLRHARSSSSSVAELTRCLLVCACGGFRPASSVSGGGAAAAPRRLRWTRRGRRLRRCRQLQKQRMRRSRERGRTCPPPPSQEPRFAALSLLLSQARL